METLSLPLVGGVSQEVAVSGSTVEKVTVGIHDVDRIQKVIELPRFAYAPVRNGQLVGKVRYLLDGEEIASSGLMVQQDVDALPHNPSLWEKIKDFFWGLFH